jgi:ABC-type transporter Mla subunit MlaD
MLVGVGMVNVLAARVSELQAKLDEVEGYARACRAAAASLQVPYGALSRVAVNVGGMRSRAPKVDRALASAQSAGATVDSVRSRLDSAVGDLEDLAAKYQRKADTIRAELDVARIQLAAAG